MAEVLVTGATGLLGSSLVPALAEHHHVVAVTRRPPDEPSGVRWVIHDLRRPSLPGDLPRSIDVVIHLAQGRAFRDFPEQALDTYEVNVASTARLLDWAWRAGARQFILASTGGVYPNTGMPHREDEAVDAASVGNHYAATKLAAEALAHTYESRFSVVVLRPFFMYGRVQERSMLLPRLADTIASGGAISLGGEDGLRFNPIHVSDAARAVAAALAVPGSTVVNLAGPEALSLRDAAEILGARLGREVRFEREGKSPPDDVIGDTARMAALLTEPRTALADVAGELCPVATEDWSRGA
ncbi:MAG: NAD(P)-dependent oxidoreductase [Actinomycetota bacterium]|nr:NAD(P)-dependent oxidoreductase [Actinomycetota bacterium]